MENSRNGKTIAVIALVVAVLCLSVGFATISATLTINGSGTVAGSKEGMWKIKFQNLGPNTQAAGGSLTPVAGTVGTAEEGTKPTLTDDVISGFQAVLTQPGDEIYYTFEINNDGELNAKISEVNLGELSCSTSGQHGEDVCSNLTLTLTYASDSEYQTKALAVGDTLNSKATRKVELRLKYNKAGMSAENLPDQDVTVTIGETTIIYNQAEATA